MDKLEILKKSDLFHELTGAQLRLIEKVCTEETFEAGSIICKQGKKLDKIYIVMNGLVGIVREVGPLFERQIQSASKFESVGWSGVIEPHICTATIKALKKTTVLAINAEKLRNLFTTMPEIGCKVYKAIAYVVAERLTHAFTQLLGVTSQD